MTKLEGGGEGGVWCVGAVRGKGEDKDEQAILIAFSA